jgi:hypothetical protein
MHGGGSILSYLLDLTLLVLHVGLNTILPFKPYNLLSSLSTITSNLLLLLKPYLSTITKTLTLSFYWNPNPVCLLNPYPSPSIKTLTLSLLLLLYYLLTVIIFSFLTPSFLPFPLLTLLFLPFSFFLLIILPFLLSLNL